MNHNMRIKIETTRVRHGDFWKKKLEQLMDLVATFSLNNTLIYNAV